jgi:hypothetical protein
MHGEVNVDFLKEVAVLVTALVVLVTVCMIGSGKCKRYSFKSQEMGVLDCSVRANQGQ